MLCSYNLRKKIDSRKIEKQEDCNIQCLSDGLVLEVREVGAFEYLAVAG